MMIIAGIDYSTTSPCICIHKGDLFNFKNCHFYFMSPKKTLEGNVYPKIHGTLNNVKWKNHILKYDMISDWSLDILKKHNVNFVGIEGYSMGSRSGMLFNIAENGGILKHKILKGGFEYEDVSPNTIKKFATGKGNSKKEKMQESFIEETGINLSTELTPRSDKCISPVSDIIDSYYIAKYFFEKSS